MRLKKNHPLQRRYFHVIWDNSSLVTLIANWSMTHLVYVQVLVLDTAPLVSRTIRWDKTGMLKSIATPAVTPKVLVVSDTGIHAEFYHVGESVCLYYVLLFVRPFLFTF